MKTINNRLKATHTNRRYTSFFDNLSHTIISRTLFYLLIVNNFYYNTLLVFSISERNRNRLLNYKVNFIKINF